MLSVDWIDGCWCHLCYFTFEISNSRSSTTASVTQGEIPNFHILIFVFRCCCMKSVTKVQPEKNSKSTLLYLFYFIFIVIYCQKSYCHDFRHGSHFLPNFMELSPYFC